MVERRRPGALSPISLTPRVEEIQTPAASDLAAATPQPSPEVEPEPAGATARPQKRTAVPPAAVASAQPGPDAADGTVPKTIRIQTSLALRAQTAVLRTAPEAGGHRSFTALVNAAIERELERLALEFNGGEPFEPNRGGFRTGRPLGS